MATYQDNILHKNSLLKKVCSKERLDALGKHFPEKPQGPHTLFISSAGMFEMAKQFDIVNGNLADGFFNTIGPIDGQKFTAFRKKMHLLHDRNACDLDIPSQEQ